MYVNIIHTYHKLYTCICVFFRSCPHATCNHKHVFHDMSCCKVANIKGTTIPVTRRCWRMERHNEANDHKVGPGSSYIRSYNPYKWPYKWVSGIISPISTELFHPIDNWQAPTLHEPNFFDGLVPFAVHPRVFYTRRSYTHFPRGSQLKLYFRPATCKLYCICILHFLRPTEPQNKKNGLFFCMMLVGLIGILYSGFWKIPDNCVVKIPCIR